MSDNVESLADSVAFELVESMHIDMHADRRRSIELLLSSTLQIWFKEGKKVGIKEAGKEYHEALSLSDAPTKQ